MLEPIVSSREDRAALVPNDLLMVQEADAQQPIEHLAREFAGVPDVADLEAWDERERFRPIGASVGRDRRSRVPPGPALHVARLGGSMAVQAGSIAPLRIKLDAVRRIGYQQKRLALAQQPRYGFGAGRVTAEHAMLVRRLAQKPKVPGPAYGSFGQRRRGICLIVVCGRRLGRDSCGGLASVDSGY